MALILHIETATTNCSVSLANDGKLIALKEYDDAHYSHAEQLHVFIKETLEEAAVPFEQLDAIAVSKGPGSYTGLRIGVSAAKGLCFALDIPLISIPTLASMAHQLVLEQEAILIPVLDARRMEVYSCIFNQRHELLRDTRAEIIDENTFQDFIKSDPVYILGSGAQKCKGVLKGSHIKFLTEIVPSAKEMVGLSFKKFKANDLEDVAYFEPFYLKDFMMTNKKA